MGLRWADRADPSWQHFKDHLSDPQRGECVWIWVCGPLRWSSETPLLPMLLSQVLLFLVATSILLTKGDRLMPQCLVQRDIFLFVIIGK